MNDIKIEGWLITFHGDESVGIFDGTWEITPEMYFDDQEGVEQFRVKIREAFSWCADESCLDIETFEEVKKRVSDEDAFWESCREV